jgi:NAD(P) transhydrogenase
MRSQNVTFRLGEGVERIEVTSTDPRRAAITLESASTVVSDLLPVLRRPHGLHAGSNMSLPGLKADERGRLTVDPEFRTSGAAHLRRWRRHRTSVARRDVGGAGASRACYAFGVPNDGMSEHFPIGIYSIPSCR